MAATGFAAEYVVRSTYRGHAGLASDVVVVSAGSQGLVTAVKTTAQPTSRAA
jgi:ribulose 1,5-bisphosphate synthetase/thiazole synthase